MSELQRLVIEFKAEELVCRCLYRRGADGPNPDTKAREVTDLTRAGLTAALRALEGDVESVGTSGFITREDVLLATPATLVRGEGIR